MTQKKRRGSNQPEPQWIVTVNVELHGVSVFVTAATAEEAMQKANSMDWDEIALHSGEMVNCKARKAEENR